MAINCDGWTLLIYDKYANGHNYNNNFTTKVKIDDLLLSDCPHLVGKDAIKEFNKFGNGYYIDDKLDDKFYQVNMYITHYGNNKNNIAKYTIIGINNDLLKKYVINKISIPNKNFLIQLCRFHNNYTNIGTTGIISVTKTKKEKDEMANNIITKIKLTTGDVTDKMVDSPNFLNCKLYDYQKRSIYWMKNRELEKEDVIFNINDEVVMGDVFFDTMKQQFTLGKDRKKNIIFRWLFN